MIGEKYIGLDVHQATICVAVMDANLRMRARGRGMLRTFFAPKSGDPLVIAPDGSRAGLVWEASDKPYFHSKRSCPSKHASEVTMA